jgi:hypothetical protein
VTLGPFIRCPGELQNPIALGNRTTVPRPGEGLDVQDVSAVKGSGPPVCHLGSGIL